MARRVAREEGLLVGPSAGANVHAAAEVAGEGGSGDDHAMRLGERYLE
ncbi:MAG: hypothetical protein R3B70_35625 [Polyangiaceae bacterium]